MGLGLESWVKTSLLHIMISLHSLQCLLVNNELPSGLTNEASLPGVDLIIKIKAIIIIKTMITRHAVDRRLAWTKTRKFGFWTLVCRLGTCFVDCSYVMLVTDQSPNSPFPLKI